MANVSRIPEIQFPFNVLVVEQDPKQSELYSDLIREVSDCKVDVISRIERSFDWISQSNYHLVVIATTPGPLSGLDLLEQVKRSSPSTSVILISEQGSVEQAVAAIRMGADANLKKPFNLEAFKLAVKRGLDFKVIFGEDYGAFGFLNLLNTCQMISASLEERKILEMIQSYLARELGSNHFAFYSFEEGRLIREEELTRDSAGDQAMVEILDIALQAANPFPQMIESNEFYRFVNKGQLTPGLFVFRFKCARANDYFCVCLSPKIPALLEAFESRMKMLRTQIEVTGKNIEQFQGVQALAYVDDATGLYNTRYLNQILDREIIQARATKKSFAVLFIDVDKFKNINDTHGHLVGTKILNELGNQLKTQVREKDTLFRYGGDEFVAVLTACDLPTAKAVADRIRKSVEHSTFLKQEGLNIKFTTSIGVALFPDHANSKKAIIDAADQAMYASKRSTRNAVTIASPKPAKGRAHA